MDRIVFVPSDDNENFGNLCVASPWPSYDKPEMVTPFYPITDREYVKHLDETLIGQDVRSTHDGRYACVINGNVRYIHLLNGGQTLPIKTTIEPIPAPKTRCKVRYESGRWQKYTKEHGWESC